MSNTIANYKSLIEKATTKEELGKISYAAFLADPGNLWHGKLANQVDALCILREIELGLLPSEPRAIAMLRKQAKTGKECNLSI